MIQFVTLSTITNDLLNVIRGSQVTQSEPISKRQVEAWIHQYRALLLKRDLDKNKVPNPDYIQTIQALELQEVDEAQGTNVSTDYKTFRSTLQLPKTLDLNFKSGFTYIGTITGQEIQFVPETRVQWRQHTKYTPFERLAYLKDGYLYVGNDKELKYVTVRGIFEIPPEISHLENPREVITDVTEDSEYPIPIDKVPILKEMILQQELGIMSQGLSDLTNESASKIESPLNADVKYTNRSSR